MWVAVYSFNDVCLMCRIVFGCVGLRCCVLCVFVVRFVVLSCVVCVWTYAVELCVGAVCIALLLCVVLYCGVVLLCYVYCCLWLCDVLGYDMRCCIALCVL